MRGLGEVWEGSGREGGGGGLDLGEDKNGSAVYFPTSRHDAVARNMRCVHSKVCAPVRLEHVVLSEALHRVGVDWKRRSRGGALGSDAPGAVSRTLCTFGFGVENRRVGGERHQGVDMAKREVWWRKDALRVTRKLTRKKSVVRLGNSQGRSQVCD